MSHEILISRWYWLQLNLHWFFVSVVNSKNQFVILCDMVEWGSLSLHNQLRKENPISNKNKPMKLLISLKKGLTFSFTVSVSFYHEFFTQKLGVGSHLHR